MSKHAHLLTDWILVRGTVAVVAGYEVRYCTVRPCEHFETRAAPAPTTEP